MIRHSMLVVYRRQMTLFFIGLVGLFVAGVADGGVNTWTSIGLEGRSIQALAIDPDTPTTVYAGTLAQGVFKSTNGGENWTAINTGLTSTNILTLVIDPDTPTTVYAGTADQGVFKSTNGGENWTAINTGLAGATIAQALAINPDTPTTVYAGISFGGVFKSTNGGENWTDISTTLPPDVYGNLYIISLAIDPGTPTTLYTATYDQGVFKSTNDGENWTATGLTSPQFYSLAIDPHTPTTIYAGSNVRGAFKSTNGGENSTAINTGLPNTEVQALAIDPDKPTTVYAGISFGGVFKSTTGGENWTALNEGLTNTNVLSLAIDPSNPGTIYAGTDGGGVFKFSSPEGPPSLQVSKAGTGDGRVTSNPSGIDCGSTCTGAYNQGTTVTLTATPSSGSVLVGWSGACSGTGDCVVTMDSDKSVTATFNSTGGYSLAVVMAGAGDGTVTSSPAGISCGSSCSETFQTVTKVKLTATANPDSIFKGWSGGGYTGTKPCQVTVNSAITITATFDKKVPHISVSGNSLDFGSVKVGKSLKKTLKITNNGTGDLTVSIGGVGGTDFSVAGSTSVTVKPNKSYSLGITFKPSSKGSETGTLVLTTNDPTSATISISLTGTGT